MSVFLLTDNEPDAEETNEERITTYSPEFEAFWSIYPKRINKWQAWGEWRAALLRRHPRQVTAQQLLVAAMNYAQHAAAIEQRYVMLPATFLGSGRRYLEYLGTAWPGMKQADSDASLSRGAAQALVQTINMAPPALCDQAYQNVRWRLQGHGYDLDCGSDGLFFLRE